MTFCAIVALGLQGIASTATQDALVETSLCDLGARRETPAGQRVRLTLRASWGGGVHDGRWWDPDCASQFVAVYFDSQAPNAREIDNFWLDRSLSGKPPGDVELVLEATLDGWAPVHVENLGDSPPAPKLTGAHIMSWHPI